MTSKRNADEDQHEQPEKKNENEQEEREVKTSTDDWETYAKELKAGAERRAEESKKAKVGDDMADDTVMEAIGSI